jgi:hypothetical protein
MLKLLPRWLFISSLSEQFAGGEFDQLQVADGTFTSLSRRDTANAGDTDEQVGPRTY